MHTKRPHIVFAAIRGLSLLAICLGGGAANSSTTRLQQNNNSTVRKRVFSDKFRMVFIAGLEGTGHHYIMDLDSHMFEENPNLPRISKDKRLTSEPYYLPETMGRTTHHYTTLANTAVTEMRALAEEAATLPSPGTVYVLHNSWSYPAFPGTQKVMQYLDLRRIAEVAESQAIDMRVLYLRRSAREIVIANTVHRRFQGGIGDPTESEETRFLRYIRIIFTDMAVLHSLLAELDPSFVVCHDWERRGDDDQASTIAEFIAPTDVAEVVKDAFGRKVGEKHPGMDTLPFEGAEELILRLQQKLDVFDQVYCMTSQ